MLGTLVTLLVLPGARPRRGSARAANPAGRAAKSGRVIAKVDTRSLLKKVAF